MAAPEAVRVEAQPPEGARFVDRDTVLVDRLRDGDESAFSALYDRYFQRVYDFVDRRLGNRADTEETVQEVFINIFSSIGGWRGDAPFEAWVLGLTRRTIARRFRRKRAATVPLESEETEPTDPTLPFSYRAPSPHDQYERNERLRLITRRAERELSAEQLDLFERHHLRNQPVREIAQLLRKSEDAVKSNLYRARRILLAR